MSSSEVYALPATIERTARGGWVLRADQPRGAALRIQGPWDWAAAACLTWEAQAATNGRVRVTVEHGPETAARRWVFYFVPKPGLRLRIAVPIADLRVRPHNTARPGYFTFGGGPDPTDLARVLAVTMEYDQDGPPAELTIEDLHADAVPITPAILEASPCVDPFGQWTGLGGAPSIAPEIRARWAREDLPLPQSATPPVRGPSASVPTATPTPLSRWGGDARHRLDATGRFRVDRWRDRWCLVDPDGHPFFSVGPDVVRPNAEGPTAGKEALFADLSEAGAGEGRADFYALNLRRRHQAHADVAAAWAAATKTRLRSWGFNTIANWSTDHLFAGGDMPWVTGLGGLNRWCDRVPDVFAPAFSQHAAAAVQDQVQRHADDAALIGYFVGNEPAWTFPGAIHPFQTIFEGSHPHTAAEAIAFLRARYADDLTALGDAWEHPYASWEGLVRTGPPDPRTGPTALQQDATEFAGRILDRFYRVCCGAVRALDPARLLLGARFYSVSMPEPYLRACRVFDVVSFNCYQRVPPTDAVARMAALTGRPTMIGEFHFGVCGRGMSGALITVPDDAARGQAYATFVRAAATDPAIVGAHWFQWVDEPVTGRFDGEDYNIGLVDVTDVPYAGLIAGAHQAHVEMYRLRFGA